MKIFMSETEGQARHLDCRIPASLPRRPGGALRIAGILNITRDSFSDGGRYLTEDSVFARARDLWEGGADIIDVGVESSNPDGESPSEGEQIAILERFLPGLKERNYPLAIDSFRPGVVARALELGVEMVNDITGFQSTEMRKVVRRFPVPVVAMFNRSREARARRAYEPDRINRENIVKVIREFFAALLADLEAEEHDFHRNPVLLDPGMGFFLGGDPELSWRVLRQLEEFRGFEKELYLSVSRKSFLGAGLGNRPSDERGAASLVVELWAALSGAGWIRTHDPAGLRDAVTVTNKLYPGNNPWPSE